MSDEKDKLIKTNQELLKGLLSFGEFLRNFFTEEDLQGKETNDFVAFIARANTSHDFDLFFSRITRDLRKGQELTLDDIKAELFQQKKSQCYRCGKKLNNGNHVCKDRIKYLLSRCPNLVCIELKGGDVRLIDYNDLEREKHSWCYRLPGFDPTYLQDKDIEWIYTKKILNIVDCSDFWALIDYNMMMLTWKIEGGLFDES